MTIGHATSELPANRLLLTWGSTMNRERWVASYVIALATLLVVNPASAEGCEGPACRNEIISACVPVGNCTDEDIREECEGVNQCDLPEGTPGHCFQNPECSPQWGVVCYFQQP